VQLLARSDMRHRLKTSVVIRGNQNTGRNTRGLNRSTNFRLRLALGTLARARHAAAIGAKQCVPTRRRNRTDTVRTLAPTSASALQGQPLEYFALTGPRLIRINQRQLAGRAG
jgi:uncharacterized protein YwbE